MFPPDPVLLPFSRPPFRCATGCVAAAAELPCYSAVIGWNRARCCSTAQAIRASLLASATMAVFRCARVSRLRNHSPRRVLLDASGDIAARAPWISNFRRYLLPRFVMPTSRRIFPPVVISRGTNPSHAARSRPREKLRPSPIAAIKAVAFITPIPGIVASRLASSPCRAQATNSASNASMRTSRSRRCTRMSSISVSVRWLKDAPPPEASSSARYCASLRRPCGTRCRAPARCPVTD
jgi:hypothetical protein